MRAIVLGCALLLPFAAIAQDMLPPGGGHGPGRGGGPQRGGGRLFISPMGEPFRSAKGGAEPQDLWFAGADTNHDNALTRAEFQADAMRFFQLLDRKHDGEIDPEDLEYYETVMAPEIRVGVGGYGGVEGGGSGEEGASKPVYPDRQGAARYGYFSFPEPVAAADTNFNRGVSWNEFRRAADARFDVLDTNGDGKIDKAELPKIDPPRIERQGKGGGGGDEGRRGGRRGGMGGGGMGGGGMGGGGGGMGQPGGGF